MNVPSAELGVAVVGAGIFGQTHIRVYQSIPRVKVVAVCDINLDQARKTTAQFRIPIATSRIEEILANPEVRGVSVVTPEAHHREAVIQALEAGRHVLCEKPLATNLDDARAMCDAAKRTGRILMPAHVVRFVPKIVRAWKELVKIGAVVSIHARRNRTMDLREPYLRSHPFLETGVHDIDIIRWFIGKPARRVYAVTRTVINAANPDLNWGIIEFEGGAVGVIETIWIVPKQSIETLVDAMHIVARHGTIDIRFDDDGMRIFSEEGIQIPHLGYWNESHSGFGGGMYEEIAYFLRCVDRDEQPTVIRPEDGLEAVRIAKALIESSERRAPVDLS
jgi:predicted dehydrogenase